MIARRQFIQSFLTALAALTLPSASKALPAVYKTPLPLEPRHEEFPTTSEEVFTTDKQIKVIGVGGAGCNSVHYMIASDLQGVEFICVSTDAQSLTNSSADKTIQLGCSGLGTGSRVDLGCDAANETEEALRAAIEGADMLFITAGLGGGTGTGAAPVIARIAKDLGILTVGVVIMPFAFEGERRSSNAEVGLIALQANVDSLIVIPSENLLEILGDEVTLELAFGYVNDQLKNAIGGIVDVINASAVSFDFIDVCTIMGGVGRAATGTALASGPLRARIAAEQALACPLMEGLELSGATGVMVLITASKNNLKLSESKLVMDIVRAQVSPDAQEIYGMTYDESLNDEIRVTVVTTGLSSSMGSGTS